MLQAQHWSAHSNQNDNISHIHGYRKSGSAICFTVQGVRLSLHISEGIGKKKTITTVQYQKSTMQAVYMVLSTNLSKAQYLHALQNSTKMPAGQDEIFGQCEMHKLFGAPRGAHLPVLRG